MWKVVWGSEFELTEVVTTLELSGGILGDVQSAPRTATPDYLGPKSSLEAFNRGER